MSEDDPFAGISIETDPLVKQIDGMLEWLTEDYGPAMLGAVVAEMLKRVRAFPGEPIENLLYEIALDWSK